MLLGRFLGELSEVLNYHVAKAEEQDPGGGKGPLLLWRAPYEDRDEDVVSFVGRVQTDEAAVERPMTTGTRRREHLGKPLESAKRCAAGVESAMRPRAT